MSSSLAGPWATELGEYIRFKPTIFETITKATTNLPQPASLVSKGGSPGRGHLKSHDVQHAMAPPRPGRACCWPATSTGGVSPPFDGTMSHGGVGAGDGGGLIVNRFRGKGAPGDASTTSAASPSGDLRCGAVPS
jgi:hypothetical protein